MMERDGARRAERRSGQEGQEWAGAGRRGRSGQEGQEWAGGAGGAEAVARGDADGELADERDSNTKSAAAASLLAWRLRARRRRDGVAGEAAKDDKPRGWTAEALRELHDNVAAAEPRPAGGTREGGKTRRGCCC